MESKKAFLTFPAGLQVTIEELKIPALAKMPHEMNKEPNIPLFHIGTCFSLKMDVKRAAWQNLPLLQFLEK